MRESTRWVKLPLHQLLLQPIGGDLAQSLQIKIKTSKYKNKKPWSNYSTPPATAEPTVKNENRKKQNS